MTPAPDDYMAVSKSPQNYTIDDVYEQITREGSTVTKAEALAVFEEITQGIINLVKQGNSISTPLVNISSSVSGVFDGDDDSFDANRHQVRISVNPGNRLRKVASEITTKKVAAAERKPTPVHYHDNGSESQDEVITTGRGARITGSLLKFDEQDLDQGIFFVKLDDNSEVRVEPPVLKNKPGELIFMNPELDPGDYRLEVRSIVNGTTQVRSGAISVNLSVAGA